LPPNYFSIPFVPYTAQPNVVITIPPTHYYLNLPSKITTFYHFPHLLLCIPQTPSPRHTLSLLSGLKSKIYPSTLLSTTNITPHETTFTLLSIINHIYAYGITPMAQLILNGLPNTISPTLIDVSIPFHFYSITTLQDNANILNIPYSLTSLPTNIKIPNLLLFLSKYH
jgi:hypothetical protein